MVVGGTKSGDFHKSNPFGMNQDGLSLSDYGVQYEKTSYDEISEPTDVGDYRPSIIIK